MKRYDRVTPDGTKDLLFTDCKLRRAAEAQLRSLFESFGYDEVMTPSLEFYDVFSDGVGKVSQNELYTLTDSNGRLMTMRPDSTKPIARLFSSRLRDAKLPVRLYYAQSTYKRQIKFSKKSDEIFQTGIELIGADGLKADMEAVILAVKSLQAFAKNDFLIELGHMGVVQSLFDKNIPDKTALRRALATKNLPALQKLAAKSTGDAAIFASPEKLFGGMEVLENASEIFTSESAQSAIKTLKFIANELKKCGLEKNVLIDLSIISEYEYYTGLVFRGYESTSGKEVLSGGRYDSLYAEYGHNLPAIGFALDVDGIARIMQSSDTLNRKTEPQIAVLFAAPSDMIAAQALAKEMKSECKIVLSLEESESDSRQRAVQEGANFFLTYKGEKIEEEQLC